MARADDEVMDVEVVAALRCPLPGRPPESGPCGTPLSAAGHSLRCGNGHSYDMARQGYVDLTCGKVTHTGDTTEMIAARSELIGAGRLDAVTSLLREAVQAVTASNAVTAGNTTTGIIVDIGAGTGQHLAAVLDATPRHAGLAVDISKAALRRAARAHPMISAIRADVWRGLPIADGAASVILDVFAPRSPTEFHRILRADGALLVLTPGPDHLAELVSAVGLLAVAPAKRRRLSEALDPYFHSEREQSGTASLRLSRAEAQAMIRMGPSAWHLEPERVAHRLGGLPEPITATVSVQLGVWRPRHGRTLTAVSSGAQGAA